MNRDFLYEKPRAIGFIDDTVEDNDSWFQDNPWSILQDKIQNSTLVETVNEVVAIFEEGAPNYRLVFGLFGSGLVAESGESKTIHRLKIMECINNNITNSEMHVNNDSILIEKFCLCLSMNDITPSFTVFVEELGFCQKDNSWERKAGSSIICIVALQ
ncbi:hypothetical protein [Candidatus Pristimantibacillus sp. PTI5]|uniref:hypothetical protein n=1 Tax=Candidatus Pristimantibacillus sp. PTI5 TaxID=3400422 RepID=UPI003B013194